MADLLALPARALTDTGASQGRTRRVVARLRDIPGGQAARPLLLAPEPPFAPRNL
jgi:hypothetical protein